MPVPPPLSTPDSDPRDKEYSSLLDKGRDEDYNWNWPDEKDEWKAVKDDSYQEFYNHWRNSSHNFGLSKPFPYKLPLGSAPPLHPLDTSKEQIVVTKSYHEMYYRLLHLRKATKPNSGVVITGQPGIGKSIFLNFMLARLISANQPILLLTQSTLYLFYQGTVSKRNGTNFLYIPTHKRDKQFTMWTLIDSDDKTAPPPIANGSLIWPIQACSPNPIRWKTWSKQREAAIWGMPLWDRKELDEGLTLCPEYEKFGIALGEALKNKQTGSDDGRIDAALNVLQGNDVEMADVGQPPDVKRAFDTLMENSIAEFGFAPRDVYFGVFNLPQNRRNHAQAVRKTDYAKLAAFATQFSEDRHLDSLSHNVIAVKPTEDLLLEDKWEIDFKSARVLEEVMTSAERKHDTYLWSTYHTFWGASASSTLAGHLFEEIVHRMFTHGWKESYQPQPTPMISDRKTPPTFFSDPTPAWVPLLPPLFVDDSMDSVFVDMAVSDDLNVTLDSNVYYRPKATNNALFDSFTIRRDLVGAVLISIFQITVSPSHGGSSEGYRYIHKIVKRVQALQPMATVRVTYFLVCPEGEIRKWIMPARWDQDRAYQDHRGEAYCVRVRVPGTLCLFTPNFQSD